jgi:hypothetical protein
MMQCRKIYCNLLLLSVMLFAFSVSARPCLQAAVLERLQWNSASEQAVEFRWDNRSGAIVYRSCQLTAAFGNEWVLLQPAEQDELHSFSQSVRNVIWGKAAAGQTGFFIYSGRAPPQSV